MRDIAPWTASAVIVTRSDIFPANHGAAVKVDRTAYGLSYFLKEVVIVTGDRTYYYVYRQGTLTRKKYPAFFRIFAPSENAIIQQLKDKGLPVSDIFLYYGAIDWSYVVRTLYIAWKHGISIFTAETASFARSCFWGRSLFGGIAVSVEHNIEYKRLADQYPETSPDANRYLRNLELECCRRADAVICVSKNDCEILIDEGLNPEKIHHIPHGVDIEKFDQRYDLNPRKILELPEDKKILAYHGIYMYPPNLEAVKLIGTELLPRLNKKGLSPKVFAIGPYPPADFQHDDIIFTGAVDNVAPWLKNADVAVVTLMQGGGTRMKILDYFAAKIPVVSTSKGIEGIPVENGIHACISDDWDQFADIVAELLQDSNKARSIGQKGRDFVQELSWLNIAERYVQLYRSLKKVPDTVPS